MNPEDFKDKTTGYLVPTIQGCMAFVPNPLPPLNLNFGRLAGPLADAALVLGELSGIGRTLPNPNLLIRPFSRVEAVASSKIEGTVTSVPELLTLEVAADTSRARSDTREVHNYTRALNYGLNRVVDFPITKRLFCELHEILLEGVSIDRGARIVAGELKSFQNWIGARTIENARFIPPPPAEAVDALDELERFIHRSNEELPLLVKLALVHYQFETIHPFPDGNGRIGRLIIPLMLCEKNVMSQPLLYLSTYFEKHYDEYIDLLLEVSRSGAWNQWVLFFLKGVESTARSAITKAHALQDLHRQYLEKIRVARSSALLGQLVDSLFAVPATTVPYVVKELGISYNAAKNNLQKLVDLQIITPDFKTERPQWFFGVEIIKITSTPDF